MKKESKGITLIALVITIIVLLILAGVTISTLTGENGILTKTQRAKIETEEKTAEEKVKLEVMGSYGEDGKLNKELLISNLGKIGEIKKEDWPIQVIVEGEKFIVNEDGTIEKEGREESWENIKNDLLANPDKYLQKAKELGQEEGEQNIGIGTDKEVVNLSMWNYKRTDDGNAIKLGDNITSCGEPGYKKEYIKDGKIIGKIPQYIYIKEDNIIYDVREMTSTFNYYYTRFEGGEYTENKLTEIPEIPDTVVEMNSTFFDCQNLKELVIPKTVKKIGEYTFDNCTSLKSIDIQSGVVSIEGYAFYNCTSLTSINIPSSVTSIGYSAFSGCTSLASINIPSSVTSIGYSAFYRCTSLASINIPSSVTSLGRYTFLCWTEDQTINCEVESQPKGWDEKWDYYDYNTPRKATINWNYKNSK